MDVCHFEEMLGNLIHEPVILREYAFPNLSYQMWDGRNMWLDVAVLKGWKVQRNLITGLYRIIDDNNVRRAWGTLEMMEEIYWEVVDVRGLLSS
ncbi:MAG: hypothetical protein FWF59_03345 [Turicibacter sp.]|nr:hypothetical protein [Turicibacter sp.]